MAFPHRPHLLLLLLTSLTAISLLSDVSSAALGGGGGSSKGALVGGWKIADPKSSEVVESAKYAIDAYNKEAQTKLQFDTVVSAQEQVVSGTNYKLVIKVLDGSSSDLYEAVVWVKPWLKFKKLTSFKKLPNKSD